jgi:hypothetical protein
MGLLFLFGFFSVQFRENLEIACALHPSDEQLTQLRREECDTGNLSPWPGIAGIGEKLNHDEFIRRLLSLSVAEDERRDRFDRIGQAYLRSIRGIGDVPRALSIASYEDGGLESVFRAILRARHWDSPPLQAFKHFLVQHILFDNAPVHGHGTLSRHLAPDDQILPLWTAFKDILVAAVPKLAAEVCVT